MTTRVETWQGHNIRFVLKNDEWWAILSDVCKALGIDPMAAFMKLDEATIDQAENLIPSVDEYLDIVNEVGIYELMFLSNLSDANRMRFWTGTVLKRLRNRIGLSEYEVMRMMDDDIQEEIDNLLDDIFYDEETGKTMISVTSNRSQSKISCKGETGQNLSVQYRQKTETNFLYPYQLDAVNQLKNGCILCGAVGSGKSRTALFWYFKENGGWIDKDGYSPMRSPKDLYIITTAKKRDSKEWLGELVPFLLYPGDDGKTRFGNKIVVDSWNNIGKYVDAEDSYFLLDEQRLVSYGAWTKSFLTIAKSNKWILLSGTPGDSYVEYLPVFLGNGFFKNKTEFNREHVIFSRYTKYPKIDRYVNTTRLDRLRDRILVNMDYTHDIVKHNEDIYCSYDIQQYKFVIRNRKNIYKENEPIQNAGEMCNVLRRIVNSDETRQIKLLEILESHPRAIIFYNYDYEREILLNLGYEYGTEIAEWNGHAHQPVPEGNKWVYICQYNSASEGWNCIRTNCVIFYSQNYSYKMMTQAAGRVDRLNTPYDELYYYYLKSRSGIDLAVSRALADKKKFNEGRFVGWNKSQVSYNVAKKENRQAA